MGKIFFKNKSKKGKFLKIAIIIIILIMIIVMATLYERNDNIRIVFDKYIFMKNVYENDLPEIKTESKNVFAYKDSILVFENNELISYNKYGKEEYSLNIELVNPIFQSNEDYMCLAEKNGSNVYVISQKNIVWQANLSGNISKVSLNKNGYCAITLFGTTDKSVVMFFNAKGEELFSKHIAEDYVIDTDISEDNQYLAIAKVSYSGIDIKSTIEVIQVKDAKEGKTVVNEYKADLGDLIININYNNKNTLVSMYDKYISTIKNNQITKKVDFNEEEILFSDINNKIIKILKTNKEKLISKIELQILDIETEQFVPYEIEEPKAVYVFENMIAINFGSEAVFINNNGWMIKEYKSSQEINNIVISNDIAGIIYKNKVEIISL